MAAIATDVGNNQFVNGNYDGAARQSPLSYVCTKLIDSICAWTDGMRPKYPSILAQAFFCGQHMELDDPESGPCGMMRSLLSQLILSYKAFNLPSLEALSSLNSDDVQELTGAYSLLIEKLPRRCFVFCIIDGISVYEDSPKRCKQKKRSMLCWRSWRAADRKVAYSSY